MGIILKCEKDDHVRCCGVSIEKVVGLRSSSTTMSTTTTDEATVSPTIDTTVDEIASDTTTELPTDDYSDGTEPNGTEPNITEPNLTEPNGTEPNVTEPNVTEPNGTEPNLTESNETDSDQVTELDEATETAETADTTETFTVSLPEFFIDNNLLQIPEENVEIRPIETTTDPSNGEGYVSVRLNNVELPIETENFESSSESDEMASTEEADESQTTTDLPDRVTTITEQTIEVTTSAPQIDSRDLQTTALPIDMIESIAATTAPIAANKTFPTIADLISTMEASNGILDRNNKRRNSVYTPKRFTPTTSVPLAVTEALQTDQSSSESKTLTNPSLENAKNHYAAHKDFLNRRKLANAPKLINSTSTFNENIKATVDNEHKKTISSTLSMLSKIAKLSGNQRPVIQRSSSLRQLMDDERLLLKPSFGRKHLYNKNAAEPVTPIAETDGTIEMDIQTEKPKRKYSRRLPAKSYAKISYTPPTTPAPEPTTTTTKAFFISNSDKEGTKSRHRFSIRKPNSPKIAEIKSTTTTTTETPAAINLSKERIKPSNEKPINVNDALERRKKLFASRRGGGWAKAAEVSNNK